MSYIEKVSKNPSLLKNLSIKELEELCEEIRRFIIEVVSKNGGHLSSNLGVVELTVCLHYVFDIPPDKIIWDVGHQCYTHKILTGRYEKFKSLRKYKGISGFPEPEESPADIFHTGHAGTAISSATGLKFGQDFLKDNSRVICVIGDGSLTNGVTFEGLNFLGSRKKNILLILNDNKMSISPTKGALSYYLTKLITSPIIEKPKEEFLEILRKSSSIGEEIAKFTKDIEKKTKYLLVPGVFFEKLGFRYLGPIDGHDVRQLIDILKNLREIKEPVVLHVITKKGKGYKYAEQDPSSFHSAGKFNIENGKFISKGELTPSLFVGKFLEEIGEREKRLVVITAAMEKGLGLEGFAKKFPDRFFDVGISESHAVVFASGLAKSGMKVVVAIYSTFLQRAYDQIFHDICLQRLPVIFLIDRAGIVGEDGPTHHGNFDISYLRTLPYLNIYSPYSIKNLKDILMDAVEKDLITAIRYPKASLPYDLPPSISGKEKGLVAIIGFGSMGKVAFEAGNILRREGLDVEAFPSSRIKPIDEKIKDILLKFDFIVSVEENTLIGGAGSGILEYLNDKKITKRVLRIGLPDKFIEHGERNLLLEKYGLTPEKVAEKIREFVND